MKLDGWGRYPRVDADLYAPKITGDLQRFIKERKHFGVTPRGLGRSYGDSSLGNTVVSTDRKSVV